MGFTTKAPSARHKIREQQKMLPLPATKWRIKLETEAKFVVPGKETFARLSAVERFGPYEKRNETIKTVHDRYVDTPDHRFYNSQLFVRLREGKDGHILLTIKRLGEPPKGAIHARDEYQIQVPSIERKEWPEGEVRSMVDDIAGDQPLVDLAAVDQTRTVSNLVQGDRAVAELSLDEVTIQTAHGPVTAYELEAELLERGLTSDLDSLVHVFTDEYGLQPQPLSKFERAMSMADGDDSTANGGGAETPASGVAEAGIAVAATPSQPDGTDSPDGEEDGKPLLESGLAEPAEPINDAGDAGQPVAATAKATPKEEAPRPSADKREIGLKRTDSIDTASRKIVQSYFDAMLANEKGTIEGEDPEALHDMRVATRRMRAALRVLGPYLQDRDPTRVRHGLRAIAQSLGSVRDMDVLIINAGKFRDSLPEEQRPDLDGLIGSWKAERDRSRKRLIRLLESKDYDRFKKQVNQFIKEQEKAKAPSPATITDLQPFQVRHIAPTAILTRYEAVRSFEAITEAGRRKERNKSADQKPAVEDRAPGDTQSPIHNSQFAMPPTIEQLHALRISGKYLRYTLECFRETLPPDASLIIRDVTKMQDQLGDLHDADVATGLIREYIESRTRHRKNSESKSKKSNNPQSTAGDPQSAMANPQSQVPPGLAAYLEEREAAIRHIHADFFSTWSRMQSPEWRARLAAVIMA
jgi:CHAD domain-containing protein